MPKQHFIAMACDLESYAIILWSVISMKLNIDKKIKGLEIMIFHHEKIYYVTKLIELMFGGELHCLRGCFRKQTGREDVSTHLKCFCALFKRMCLFLNTI